MRGIPKEAAKRIDQKESGREEKRGEVQRAEQLTIGVGVGRLLHEMQF